MLSPYRSTRCIQLCKQLVRTPAVSAPAHSKTIFCSSQIRQLQIQMSQIHYSIPGFRSHDYSHPRSPLPADLPVGDCTPQQLWVALMLNSGFNSFDPYQVASDLYENPQLWHGFALLPDIETMTREQHPRLWRRGYLRFLPLLEERHNCDTLYILSADDEHVFELVNFGQEWQADDVQVYAGEAAARLVGDEDDRALPVLRYWWD
ncbi:hypothetical protein H6F67_12405 [Microcoleus sp. FACHB-1515]|uniref:hypothetical protein n=1 Tax=Cyanophyceae TaxID=3028117 RepID=UPI00168881B7|nr:hypothetical protein [Microcoleus sp. FACHB-1515]MBD2090656.1 hypothetical protein [Microcoleus sp. FACHB-1515]